MAAIAADGVFAQPALIAGDHGATAVVISLEQMAILREHLNDTSNTIALSDQELAANLGLVIDSDGTLRGNDG